MWDSYDFFLHLVFVPWRIVELLIYLIWENSHLSDSKSYWKTFWIIIISIILYFLLPCEASKASETSTSCIIILIWKQWHSRNDSLDPLNPANADNITHHNTTELFEVLRRVSKYIDLSEIQWGEFPILALERKKYQQQNCRKSWQN